MVTASYTGSTLTTTVKTIEHTFYFGRKLGRLFEILESKIIVLIYLKLICLSPKSNSFLAIRIFGLKQFSCTCSPFFKSLA